MDFGLIGGIEPLQHKGSDPESGVPPFEYYEPARLAMCDTKRYANRLPLIEMEPRQDISSTRYALVAPGHTVLVLEPEGSGSPFTVELTAGRWQVEWFDVLNHNTHEAALFEVTTTGKTELTAPFDGAPAVVLLTRE